MKEEESLGFRIFCLDSQRESPKKVSFLVGILNGSIKELNKNEKNNKGKIAHFLMDCSFFRNLIVLFFIKLREN